MNANAAMTYRSRWILLAALALELPFRAHALQPLDAFIRSARKQNPDNLKARANLEAQQAQADVALGRVLPGISVKGNYARNQYASSLSVSLDPTAPPLNVNFQHYNQLTGAATISVTLVDLASFQRVTAARTSAEASARQTQATALQVESQVAQGYFQLMANLALVASSRRALDVARTSLRMTQAQLQAGTSTVLEVERANAQVESQVQSLASAELQVALSARALQSASGLVPEALAAADFQDDLREEPGLDSFSPLDPELPSIAVAIKNREAAEQQARAQRLSLLPSIAGSFTEYATNTPGFVRHDYYWQAGVGFSWQLDLTNFANIRAQDASAAAARATEQSARLSARDAIHRYWNTVHADIATSRSARAQARASEHAALLALQAYEAGTATQLDLLQAVRDAYSAEVSRIQADADLANARAQLRLAAGRDPYADSSR